MFPPHRRTGRRRKPRAAIPQRERLSEEKKVGSLRFKEQSFRSAPIGMRPDDGGTPTGSKTARAGTNLTHFSAYLTRLTGRLAFAAYI